MLREASQGLPIGTTSPFHFGGKGDTKGKYTVIPEHRSGSIQLLSRSSYGGESTDSSVARVLVRSAEGWVSVVPDDRWPAVLWSGFVSDEE